MSTESDTTDDGEPTAQTTQPTDQQVATLDVREMLREEYYRRGSTVMDVDGHTEGSHRELDPSVFHPSQVGYDEWLLMVKKLGLDASSAWNYFLGGDMIHTYIENILLGGNGKLPASVDGTQIDLDAAPFQAERGIEHTRNGLTFVGHADCYDSQRDVVYDFKSRGSWYNFDPPVDRHLDQLTIYMDALDADFGQVVYISKKDYEVRTWPEDGPFEFDPERMGRCIARAQRVRDAILDNGFPTSADEIPFERPDTYFASEVDLDFSAFDPEE